MAMFKIKVIHIVTILAHISLSFGFNVDINKNSNKLVQPLMNNLKRPAKFFAYSFFINGTNTGFSKWELELYFFWYLYKKLSLNTNKTSLTGTKYYQKHIVKKSLL